MTDTLQLAVGHHEAGRLDQAEQLYRQVLAGRPDHADALHLLGVLGHQRGDHRGAVELIDRAIGLNPAAAPYHSNLAEALRALGNPARAEASAREALRLDPDSPEALQNLGLALRHLGRPADAVAAFESALSLRPYWPHPYVQAGEVHREQGRPFEAVAILREGIRLCPDSPFLHHALARVLLEDLGQPASALPHAAEAARLRPDRPEAQLLAGDVLAAVGRLAEAKERYREALRLAPGWALPCGQIAAVLQSQGQSAEALAWAEEAARLNPEAAGFHLQAATALYDLDRADESARRYREALRRAPLDPRARNALGYVLQDLGRMVEAEAEYREAIRLRPDYADAHLNLGLLLTETGEAAGAVAAFREALRHEPGHPEALGALGLALRDKLTLEEAAASERVIAAVGTPPLRRAVAEYGYAQALDARGQFARSASLAARANATYKAADAARGRAYDPTEHRAYVDQIIAAYSPAHFARVRGWGAESQLPVFVLGLPRSGTSLVEQILASHPKVYGAGELNLLRDLYRSLPGLVGKQAPGVGCVGDLTIDHVRTLAGRYLSAVRGLGPAAASAERVVDKMPDNYLMIGLIATILPQARIVHTRRDERDTGLSLWLTHFKHIRWATDLGHIGDRVLDYRRLMNHWRLVLPGRMIEVDYEDVVADLEGNARKLLDWVGLDWDPACLAFHQTKRVIRTASMMQVREPLYARSVGRWRHYREVLSPLLKLIGDSNSAPLSMTPQ